MTGEAGPGLASVAPATSSGSSSKLPRPTTRNASLDVARAVALVGVFVQNYAVAFNIGALRSDAWPDAFQGWLARLVDYTQGPLTTRFAASLVMIFGIGLTMLSKREDFTPWIPVRRGLVLLVAGMWFNTVWPGTILPFYGVYLIVLGPFARVRRSWTLLVGVLTITALTLLSRVLIFFALEKDRGRLTTDLSWLAMRSPDGDRLGLSNPRAFVGSMLYWGAHPLLPWLAFVLVGMWVGRTAWQSPRVQVRLMIVGSIMVALGYGVASVMTRTGSARWHWAWSTTLSSPYRVNPIKYDSPLYVLTTIGSSLAGIGLVLWMATRFAHARLVSWIARAGTVTLSIYLLHGVIPAVLFRWFFHEPVIGVGWAVALALGSWTAAMVLGSLWVRCFHRGPLEALLRRIGG